MKTTTPLFALLMLLMVSSASAANLPANTFAQNFLHPKDWSFEENLGQLTDRSGNALNDIKYFGSLNGVQVYCDSNKLSFVFTKTSHTDMPQFDQARIPVKPKSPDKTTISAARLDLEFEGANSDVQIIPGDRQEMKVNYATAFAGENGKYGVSFYNTLTYKNIYPEIDMVVVAVSQGLEYKFIVHPGGNAQDIRMTRKGADNMQMLSDGGIKYTTTLGALEESRPQSFSSNTLVNSNFEFDGNKLSFKIGVYNHKNDLVIDPGLTWATYFGSDSDDESYSIALDHSGNVFITGLTNSLVGIATSGAYQTSLAGGVNYDVLVAKFTSAGKMVWATYYGGDSSDFAIGCATDTSGNIFVSGYTLSKSGIATKGAYQTAISGSGASFDAFLAKFSNNGALQWGTYYGGSGTEYVYGLAVDAGGNPIFAGWTSSTSGIASSGSFQTSFAGGGYDAFIAKFNRKGALDWSTYYGGSGFDYALGIGVDQSSNIYITGTTSSSGGIATSGAYNTVVDSSYGSAYLARFDSTGSRKWGTYYGGGGKGDIGFGVSAKINNHVYLTGSTANATDIATKGAYQTSFGGTSGTSDAFLADFSSGGSLNWATYYGGTGNETAYGISNDSSGNIYLAGITTSKNNIATKDGLITSYGSISGGTAFMSKFSSNGVLKYGTYYGGYVFEEARSVTCDNFGNVYITGLSASPNISTSGSFQSQNAGQYDAFIAKFQFCNITTTFSGPAVTCPNSTVSYKAASHTNSTYVWTVAGGTIKSGSNTDSIVVTWSSSGPASVKVKEVNLSGCLDSMVVAVKIGTLPSPPVSGDTIVCPSSSTIYKVSPVAGVSYSWIVNGGTITSSTKLDSAVVSWPSGSGFGTVSITETYPSGCEAKNSLIISIGALPPPAIYGDTIVCASSSIKYHVISVPGSTYSWSVNNGNTSGSTSLDSVLIGWQSTGGTGKVTIKETNASGCHSSNSQSVAIASPLSIPAITGDTQVCAKSGSSYYVNNISGVKYSWAVTSGILNGTQGKDSMNILWPSAGTKDSLLIQESNASGCHASAILPVSVVALPAPSIIGDTLVCTSGASSFSVNPGNGDLYLWETTGGKISGADDQDNVSVAWPNSQGTGSVLVFVTDPLGCQGSQKIRITITTLAKPIITGYTLVCPQTSSSYHVKPAAGVKYTWSVSGGNISSLPDRDSANVFWQSSPGKASIMIQESSASGGCKSYDTLDVTIEPNNPVRISVTDIGKGNYMFKSLDSSAAESGYNWTINGSNSSGYHFGYIFKVSGSYHVLLSVTNATGCVNTLDTTIQINDAGIDLTDPGTMNIKIFPNPFKDQTEIHYSLRNPGHISILVTDILGKNIALLVDQFQESGDQIAILDGRSNHLSPGIYFVKISLNGNMETQKIVRVKD